uniref:sphingomyelin phosphodiesterase n=1 Tax=Timema douglasi TaxID=61478 RepID=A0A7R8VJG9_TIMDO|nr:unnamed protein product [Timema douglasi]
MSMGIPVVSKNRAERMKAIAEELSRAEYEVVCLQEVWMQRDYKQISRRCSAVLPHSHYFHRYTASASDGRSSGVLGSGVCVLSKFPIEDVFFHQWPVNGYIHKIQHGDWFGGKGVGLCRISVAGIKINVYTTHLHAEYDRESDEYRVHRVLQAFDLSQMVRLTSVGADVVILAGDLNTEPGDLAQRIICHNSELSDTHNVFTQAQHSEVALRVSHSFLMSSDRMKPGSGDWAFAHQQSSVRFSEDFALDSKDQKYVLNNSNKEGATETFAHWAGFKQDLSRRIDYVLFRPGPDTQVEVVMYKQPLPEFVHQRDFSFSDHEAVMASLRITKDSSVSTGERKLDIDERITSLREGAALCDLALLQLHRVQRSYWLCSATLFLLLLATLSYESPGLYLKMFNTVHVGLTLLLTFTVAMAGFWYTMERNGILAGKLGMEIALSRLKKERVVRRYGTVT